MSLLGRLFGKGSSGWAWVSVEQLRQQLAQPVKPRLVDVRGPEEFRGPDGHVPGAENQPMAQLLANPTALTRESRPVVLICLSQIRSGKVADVLSAAGLKQLAVVQGGMKAWQAAGLPIER
jgi:rhodanese-related sulfurtransferase